MYWFSFFKPQVQCFVVRNSLSSPKLKNCQKPLKKEKDVEFWSFSGIFESWFWKFVDIFGVLIKKKPKMSWFCVSELQEWNFSNWNIRHWLRFSKTTKLTKPAKLWRSYEASKFWGCSKVFESSFCEVLMTFFEH